MKAVIQCTDKDYKLLSLTQPHNKKYAELIGAEYHHLIDPQPKDFASSWGKIWGMITLFNNTNINEILCLDGDALVLDKTRNIFEFLSYEKFPGIDIHFESGGVGNNLTNLNSGVWVIKKSPNSLAFLEEISKCDIESLKQNEPGTAWEQTYCIKLFHDNPEKYKSFIKVHYPFHVFNHLSDWIFHPCIGHHKNHLQQREKMIIEAIEKYSKE